MIEYTINMWELAAEGDKQGVLYFVVIYALVVCLYSLIRQVLIKQWPVTKGVLQNASVKKSGDAELIVSEQNYKVDSLYTYQVCEKEYQGTRVSPWIIVASHNAKSLLTKQLSYIQKNEDGTVNVFYNPKKPKKSYLVKPGLFGMVVTLALAVLPLFLYLHEYL
ncbi:DUF3592 domain-containing protein [Pseudocolwellia agarivorans]|uniref:DUF3592 domain-containing protein n=1 Tax=Pseudocolwellia agarivorans TaxID=1911682 RepID=UPI0009858EAB|nr:DUF3592 domain-containing protein [Pseudocolwellia agarivorans]